MAHATLVGGSANQMVFTYFKGLFMLSLTLIENDAYF